MRVLIADDDPATLLFLEGVLGDWGYEVVTARDGTEAWERLQRADSPPLAILDWMMPGLDGVEVCRKVRQQSEAAYVYLILLTRLDRTEDLVLGMEAGADDYVSKPFEEQELRVRLRAGGRIVELQETLRIEATRDDLTDAWNRRMILQILQRESIRAGREGTPLGVIMADLDHFKRINDTLAAPRRRCRAQRSGEADGRRAAPLRRAREIWRRGIPHRPAGMRLVRDPGGGGAGAASRRRGPSGDPLGDGPRHGQPRGRD